MCRLEGYTKLGEENLVCRLKEALYGLKQAQRVWYAKLDKYLVHNNFHRCEYDPSMCVKFNKGLITIIVVYVDDMLLIGSDTNSMASIKS